VYYKFIPKGKTVNQHSYWDVLWHLQEDVWLNQPEKWRTGDWFLHHDSAPTYTAVFVEEFLAKNNTTLSAPSLPSQICHPTTFNIFL
jgi:hypothetical protein